MKKLIGIAVVFATVATISFTSCGGGGKSLKTTEDSVTYAHVVGYFDQVIKNVKADTTTDFEIFKAAFLDVLNNTMKIHPDSAQAFLQEYYTVRLPAKQLLEGKAFLDEVESSNPNVKKTESGLLYEIVAEGDGNVKVTDDSDIVKFTYEGKLKDGRVFDSSYERGDTAELPLSNLIPGWKEGMRFISKGGTIKLWVPGDLGYGAQGAGGMIGPNETLVFEVNLIDVIPAGQASK